jgi:hypothetical protein
MENLEPRQGYSETGFLDPLAYGLDPAPPVPDPARVMPALLPALGDSSLNQQEGYLGRSQANAPIGLESRPAFRSDGPQGLLCDPITGLPLEPVANGGSTALVRGQATSTVALWLHHEMSCSLAI